MRTRVIAVLVGLVLVSTLAGCAPERPFFASTTTLSVSNGFAPIVGDFDGDGWDDIWWFDEEGQDRLWEGRADGRFAHLVAPIQVDGLFHPLAGDFGGDATDDVLLYSGIDDAPGRLVILQAGGAVASDRAIATPPNAERSTIDDAEGYDGVQYVGVEAGGISVWDPDKGSDALTYIGPDAGPLPSGDFDGDGHGDLFQHRPGAQTDRVLWGDGTGGFTFQTVRNVSGSYQVTPFDADGDGHDDLAFTTWAEDEPAVMNLWFGRADRRWRNETREPLAHRGPIHAHRSHVGGGDTLVRYRDGAAESWAIDPDGVTRTGPAGQYPGRWSLPPLIGRFHSGVADDVVRYDVLGIDAESFLRTTEAGVAA